MSVFTARFKSVLSANPVEIIIGFFVLANFFNKGIWLISGDATLSSSGALTITGGVTQGFVIAMSVALWYKDLIWHKILKEHLQET